MRVENLTGMQIRDTVIVIVAILGFIVLLGNAVDKIKKWTKPRDDFESWRSDVDRKLNSDNDRLKSMEQGNKVISRGILALLSHEINGNSDDKLRKSHDEIQDYLIDR